MYRHMRGIAKAREVTDAGGKCYSNPALIKRLLSGTGLEAGREYVSFFRFVLHK